MRVYYQSIYISTSKTSVDGVPGIAAINTLKERIGATSQGCTPCDAIAAAQAALHGQPVIRDAAVSVLAPGGVVGSTVRIRVTAHIPLVVPGGGTFGLGPLTTVSAEATFRQEGWRP